MTTIQIPISRSPANNGDGTVSFRCYSGSDIAYELVIAVIEDGEEFTAVAQNLLGVVGSGSTIDEAIEDIREAFHAVAEQYESEGLVIPWSMTEISVEGHVVCKKRVLVHG